MGVYCFFLSVFGFVPVNVQQYVDVISFQATYFTLFIRQQQDGYARMKRNLMTKYLKHSISETTKTLYCPETNRRVMYKYKE